MAPPWKTELLAVFFILCALPRLAQAATSEEWKSRSIYQIVTDRFARSDNSTVAPCNAAAGEYCGGDFRGIINKLDYIQDLGFSAVSSHPIVILYSWQWICSLSFLFSVLGLCSFPSYLLEMVTNKPRRLVFAMRHDAS